MSRLSKRERHEWRWAVRSATFATRLELAHLQPEIFRVVAAEMRKRKWTRNDVFDIWYGPKYHHSTNPIDVYFFNGSVTAYMGPGVGTLIRDSLWK